MTFRSLPYHLILGLCCLAVSAQTQTVDERIAAITAQFQEAYDRDVAKPHEAAIADLDSKYDAALERALDASTSAGNLDESLRLREEKARLTEKKPLPSTDPETLPESLKSLRTTYRTTLAGLESTKRQKGLPLLKALDEQLEALQVELTQAKQIDDALIVQAKREDLREQATTQAADNPVAAVADSGPENWLDLARRRGGRLKLWGGPEPGTDIEVPTKAAKYDDYVSLDVCGVTQKFLCLKRRDGDVVIINPANLEVHEPNNVAQLCTGDMATYLGKNGTLYNPDGTERFDSRAIQKPAGFVHGYRGGLVYGAEGDFEVFRMSEDHAPPPADFLKGKTIATGAATNAMAFLTHEGKVLMWNCRTKKEIPLDQLKDLKVVEIIADSALIFLTDKGRILACDDEGRFGNGTGPAAVSNALKGTDDSFVRIQGSGAQRTDGTWLGWTLKPKMNDKFESLGAVLDLDAHTGRRDIPDLGILAWIELPPGTKPDIPSANSTPLPKP